MLLALHTESQSTPPLMNPPTPHQQVWRHLSWGSNSEEGVPLVSEAYTPTTTTERNLLCLLRSLSGVSSSFGVGIPEPEMRTCGLQHVRVALKSKHLCASAILNALLCATSMLPGTVMRPAIRTTQEPLATSIINCATSWGASSRSLLTSSNIRSMSMFGQASVTCYGPLSTANDVPETLNPAA